VIRRIAIIQGHPDPAGGHLCHRLADAYAAGALASGREARRIEVAHLDLPMLRTQADFEKGNPVPAVAAVQNDLRWASHWVIIYPLWLGDMPAVLKGFLEQVVRPDFAFRYRDKGFPEKLMTGRSAHVVVTMGMPGVAYRWFYGAHSLKSLKRNILKFIGINPIGDTLIGGVGGLTPDDVDQLVAQFEALGREGG
jgi:putative NADPH-quinone reductase